MPSPGQGTWPISNPPASNTDVVKTQEPHPAVVRIVAPDRGGQSLGSGTLVYATTQHAIVITNWHVIRDATGPIEVIFPDGFRSAGTVIKSDDNWDLAAIGIWRPNALPVSIARVAPRRGDALTIAGYGQGSYRAVHGFCTQYVAPSELHPSQMIELSAEARQGDSGGPIFNSQGELAGVLLGAAKGRTVGSYFGRVEEFLTDVRVVLDREETSATIAATEPAPPPAEPPQKPLASIPNPTDESVRDLSASERTASESEEPLAAEHPPQRAVIPAVSELVPFRRPEPASEPASDFFRPATRPQPSVATPPNPPSQGQWAAVEAPPVSDGDEVLRLTDVIGTTRGEQVKSVLAGIGVLSLLVVLFRIMRIEG